MPDQTETISQMPQTDSRIIQLLMGLRRQGITDSAVLSAIETVPRDQFVEQAFLAEAWEDRALPISCGQTISQPYIVAYMTQQLQLSSRTKVLEVGTGSGYQAAVLSRLCRRIYTIERYRSLMQLAEQRFQACGFHNVTTRYGDGALGWPEQAPFDRIIVTAAAEEVPPLLADQLALDGFMIVPVGPHGEQQLLKVTKTASGFVHDELIPVAFVPLLENVAEGGI